MSDTFKLLTILADGRFHSGATLGAALGLSRSAVWKQINALKESGIDCYSVTGKGYRLASPVELLCSEQINVAMDDQSLELLSELEIHQNIPSTNRHLMARVDTINNGHACLAEQQSAGRGRRGRAWLSPFGRNVYLSLYWQYQLSPAELSGLALAVGVGVVRTLQAVGIEDAKLKWPNDVLWQGRKMAGILLEMSGEATGPYHVVAGVGLNVDMGPQPGQVIDQPWTDIASAAGYHVSRNRVVGLLLTSLLKTLHQYERHGFDAFLDAWRQLDAFRGAEVSLLMPTQTITGYVRGVDRAGALLLETDAGLRSFYSGEVSLRLKEAERCC